MSIVVQKYGGSSVADAQKLKRVAERVMQTRASGHDVVVVVSAMGDTTDNLLALAKTISPNPDRRELDMLLSAGERISMALLSMAIRELGGDAISFTGSQSGIITNDRHVDARIIEVRPYRVEDELVRGKIVVVAGYQGVSYRKEITTLGRGGSDTTAVAMAAALGAEWCEICSDVDGVYSADPRVVSQARRIPVLSYEESQELAESGAKVLNAQAVEFAKEKSISIYARATTSPLPGEDPSADGTVVRKHGPRAPGSVIGIASEKEVLMIQSRDVDRLLTVLDDFGVPGKQLHVTGTGSEQDGLTMVVSKENLHQAAKLQIALTTIPVRWNDSAAAVSIIGAGITASNQKVLQGSKALRELDVRCFGIATSSFRVTWLVDRTKVDEVVRLFHPMFVEGPQPAVP
ncbi:MAG: aspartate kinase [Verrucomicrobia bacterium]|nr:aspartate kinase [Verrucomicrobiota bacterium]